MRGREDRRKLPETPAAGGSGNQDVRVEEEGERVERLCLAFVDTLDLRLSDAVESLHAYADLVTWARAAGAVTPAEACDLETVAAEDADGAGAALGSALVLREALYRVLTARLARRPPAPADLDVVDRHLGRVRDRLVLDGDVVAGTATYEGPALEAPLGPVVRDAAALLVELEEELRTGTVRLRACPGSPGRACGWLFVDRTRNGNRRYCVSALCGNRARAHRFADRHRAVDPP